MNKTGFIERMQVGAQPVDPVVQLVVIGDREQVEAGPLQLVDRPGW